MAVLIALICILAIAQSVYGQNISMISLLDDNATNMVNNMTTTVRFAYLATQKDPICLTPSLDPTDGLVAELLSRQNTHMTLSEMRSIGDVLGHINVSDGRQAYSWAKFAFDQCTDQLGNIANATADDVRSYRPSMMLEELPNFNDQCREAYVQMLTTFSPRYEDFTWNNTGDEGAAVRARFQHDMAAKRDQWTRQYNGITLQYNIFLADKPTKDFIHLPDQMSPDGLRCVRLMTDQVDMMTNQTLLGPERLFLESITKILRDNLAVFKTVPGYFDGYHASLHSSERSYQYIKYSSIRSHLLPQLIDLLDVHTDILREINRVFSLSNSKASPAVRVYWKNELVRWLLLYRTLLQDCNQEWLALPTSLQVAVLTNYLLSQERKSLCVHVLRELLSCY